MSFTTTGNISSVNIITDVNVSGSVQTVAGSIDIDGSFTQTGGTFTISGSDFTATGSTTFDGNLTANGTSTLNNTLSTDLTVSGGTFALSDSNTGNKANFVVPNLASGNINLTLPATSMTLGRNDPVYWIGYKNSQIGDNQVGSSWRYIHSYDDDISATPTGSFKLPIATSDNDMYFQVPVDGVYLLTSDVTRSSTTGTFMIGWVKGNGTIATTNDGIWGGIDINANVQRLSTAAVMYLTTTDYVSLAVYTVAGSVPQDTATFNRIDTAIVKLA